MCDMEKMAVERSIWIDAPRERVWRAVTEPEEIPLWLLPALPGVPMNRDDSGRLSMSMGPMETGVIQFEVVNAPRQLTSRSLPERLIATTYTLDEERGGTRVTVTMTGFEALPFDAREDRLHLSGSAWEKTLENLRAHIANVDLPFPQAAVAPLFGYWRAPKEKMAVERSIWIKAPRERVWRALIDPEQLAKWFSPVDWRSTGEHVGATLSVYNPETDSHMYTQVIEVFDPPNQLVTRTVPPDSPYVTIWTLTEENNGTRLTITHSGYELEGQEVRGTNMDQNAFGFGMMLENIRAVVEDQPLPYPGGF
jgi:uncharacterized protein YndB with AHSA1/START domain